METLHRLGYSGPGSQPLANVTVRRVSAATSLGGQDRMANILFNIRRMTQETGRAPDQRHVPVEILLHHAVMSCWPTASASISATGMPGAVVVRLSPRPEDRPVGDAGGSTG